MSIHHGKIIEKVIRRNGHSITDIARLARVNRRSVYNWFDQKNLRPNIILSIGSAINYDFSQDIPDLPEENPLSDQQAEDNVWKEKYIRLLEKHNELLQQRLESNLRSVV